MASNYRRFLALCKNWPIDSTKAAHKDLAVFIREKVAEAFKYGDATRIVEPTKCENIYESLHKISVDYHLNKYQLDNPYITASCKATRDECKAVLSVEGTEIISKHDATIFTTLKLNFETQKSKEPVKP